MSIAEAAIILKLDTSLVARYCREGRIRATQVGRQWFIGMRDLDEFASKPRMRGNPMFRDHKKYRRRKTT